MAATMVTPPQTHLDLLDRPLFAHLATVAADSSPRVNMMWFLWDADAGMVKMTHTNQRHNFRNLQANRHVALSIADPDNPYRFLQVRGDVDNVEADPAGAFYQRLQMRYRGQTSEVQDRNVRVVLSIRPTGFTAH